jgi:hypothetical protein
MNRTDVAILVHTCPNYMYILDAFFGLLRRYGSSCNWPVYLVTELHTNESVQTLINKYGLRVLPLEQSEKDFFESRAAAMKKLPNHIHYVLPLQEDFLLERPGIDWKTLEHALGYFDKDTSIASMRLMPCPASSLKQQYSVNWKYLDATKDLLFSYQATLWRREVYSDYMNTLIKEGRLHYSEITETDPEYKNLTWNQYAIQFNPAETCIGLNHLTNMFPSMIHLCYERKLSCPNGVYMCPWPYRPTAIVKGVLQSWAEELIRREGFRASKTS